MACHSAGEPKPLPPIAPGRAFSAGVSRHLPQLTLPVDLEALRSLVDRSNNEPGDAGGRKHWGKRATIRIARYPRRDRIMPRIS